MNNPKIIKKILNDIHKAEVYFGDLEREFDRLRKEIKEGIEDAKAICMEIEFNNGEPLDIIEVHIGTYEEYPKPPEPCDFDVVDGKVVNFRNFYGWTLDWPPKKLDQTYVPYPGQNPMRDGNFVPDVYYYSHEVLVYDSEAIPIGPLRKKQDPHEIRGCR